MRNLFALVLVVAAACDKPAPPPPPTPAPTAPRPGLMTYKTLGDDDNRATNTIELHVLVAAGSKHDDVETLLKSLYRGLMTRREPVPAGVSAFVYTDEVQYKTPPRSPVASVTQKPGDIGPTFDNKVPLEFWQQVEQAVEHGDKGWKLEKKIVRDDAQHTLTLTQPYTEPGKDEWSERLSYNMAINIFTDTTQNLFEKVPELRAYTFIGRWKDEDVIKITVDRGGYQSLKINEIEESVGALHGRAYLEASLGRGSDKQISKNMETRRAALYKKMLATLKGNVWVSPKLK